MHEIRNFCSGLYATFFLLIFGLPNILCSNFPKFGTLFPCPLFLEHFFFRTFVLVFIFQIYFRKIVLGNQNPGLYFQWFFIISTFSSIKLQGLKAQEGGGEYFELPPLWSAPGCNNLKNIQKLQWLFSPSHV